MEYSFAQKHDLERSHAIFFLKHYSSEGAGYDVVAIKAAKTDAFRKAMLSPGFKPEDFGVILESKMGPVPKNKELYAKKLFEQLDDK